VRSSVKLSEPAQYDLISRTIGLWQLRYRRNLSRDEARQIAQNVTSFLLILHEWARAEASAVANDNREQSPGHGRLRGAP
jgi:hypothetical protein